MYEFTRIVGIQRWLKDKKMHRLGDKPAFYLFSSLHWYQYGKLHRDNDQPAITSANCNTYARRGVKYKIKETEFYKEFYNSRGYLSSVQGRPSRVYNNGTKEWLFYGRLHRTKKPAVIYPNGDVEYWVHGKRHRIDGPAVIIGNKQYWFENGEFLK